VCTPCAQDLPWRKIPWTKKLPGIDGVWACFDYAYPIRQLIHRTKFGRDIATARLLGELLAARVTEADVRIPDNTTLLPVPLARRRLIVRGFNQAMEIALPVAARCGLPIDSTSIFKPRSGLAQSTLDAVRRRINIRGAFRHRGADLIGPVIIFDDVITTGATVTALAKTLRHAGACEIIVWALAAA
jgi:ComF family protein